jgi:hypothetical protein
MKKGDFLWLATLGIISSILIIPDTHKVFVVLTKNYPFIMGFIKFGVLATMGELLTIRIGLRKWEKPSGLLYRSIVWGFIGMLITLMFEIFSSGVTGAVSKNLLWIGDGMVARIMPPFYIAAIMNLTFAPTFMIAHRISDTYIDLICGEKVPAAAINLTVILAKIDWNSMFSFVFMKTIPFFWIPAHTVVFLLPPEYRVFAAAYLAIVLGAILSYAKRSKR